MSAYGKRINSNPIFNMADFRTKTSTSADENLVKIVANETDIATKQDTISDSSRLNANLIGDGSVSNTEFNHLGNVSGDIQGALDTKLPKPANLGSSSARLMKYEQSAVPNIAQVENISDVLTSGTGISFTGTTISTDVATYTKASDTRFDGIDISCPNFVYCSATNKISLGQIKPYIPNLYRATGSGNGAKRILDTTHFGVTESSGKSGNNNGVEDANFGIQIKTAGLYLFQYGISFMNQDHGNRAMFRTALHLRRNTSNDVIGSSRAVEHSYDESSGQYCNMSSQAFIQILQTDIDNGNVWVKLTCDIGINATDSFSSYFGGMEEYKGTHIIGERIATL